MSIKTISFTLVIGILSIVSLYTGALVFLTWPISSITLEKSGVFGDSYGLLTSLFSGLAFAGLIITILMQKDELSLQRQELTLTREELSGQKEELKAQNDTLKIQRFENTFFSMLGILESCRSDISCNTPNQGQLQGRDAIERMYTLLSQYGFHTFSTSNGRAIYTFNKECLTEEGISSHYSKFYETNGDDLGQYFRTLYNILKLIDRSAPDDDKSTYSNLLRAQLSRNELLLLFYNCVSDHGTKMLPLIQKYKILKHMEPTRLIKEHHDFWNHWNSQQRAKYPSK